MGKTKIHIIKRESARYYALGCNCSKFKGNGVDSETELLGDAPEYDDIRQKYEAMNEVGKEVDMSKMIVIDKGYLDTILGECNGRKFILTLSPYDEDGNNDFRDVRIDETFRGFKKQANKHSEYIPTAIDGIAGSTAVYNEDGTIDFDEMDMYFEITGVECSVYKFSDLLTICGANAIPVIYVDPAGYVDEIDGITDDEIDETFNDLMMQIERYVMPLECGLCGDVEIRTIV